MRAFAAIFDETRPPGDAEVVQLSSTVGSGAGTFVSGPLALAWTEDNPPFGRPLCFLDGMLYGTRDPVRDLPEGFRRSGRGALARLRGDFALIVYDDETRTGFAAVDQVGCRSLVWHTTGSRLRLASDVRFLLPLLESRPHPDEASLAHWLAVSGPPPGRTMFEGIQNLPPAHVMTLDASNPTPRRYWSPRYEHPAVRSRDDEIEGLREVLRRSVRIRSTPDAALLLSGGLDSSSVAALAATIQDERRPRHAYSATFPDHKSVDEADLIDQTCSALGLETTRAIVRSGSVIDGALEYISTWDVPPPSPNLFFWLPLLRRAASDGHSVFLDGEGGDEVFGLSPYLVADRLRHLRLRDAVNVVRGFPGGSPELALSRVRPFLIEFGVKGAAPAAVHRGFRRARRTGVPGWLRPQLRRAMLQTDFSADWKQPRTPRWWSYLAYHPGGAAFTLSFSHMRRRAMMAGVEPRHPLIDVDVIEYMLSLPPEGSFDTRFSRPRLREAVAGLLPDEIRLRPAKSTFDAIFHDSLAGPDLEVARRFLATGRAEVSAYMDVDAVPSLFTAPPRENRHARAAWAVQLWRIVTAECWLRGSDGSTGPGVSDGVSISTSIP